MPDERYFKMTVTIYAPFDGTNLELWEIAREAEQGEAFCTDFKAEIAPPDTIPDDALRFLRGEF